MAFFHLKFTRNNFWWACDEARCVEYEPDIFSFADEILESHDEIQATLPFAWKSAAWNTRLQYYCQHSIA